MLVSGGDGNSGIFPLKAHNSAFNVFGRSNDHKSQGGATSPAAAASGDEENKRSKAAKGCPFRFRRLGFQDLERYPT